MSLVLIALFALSAPAVGAPLPEEAHTCLGCHSGGGAPDPHLDAYTRSVHKEVSCTACHKEARAMPHPAKLPKPDCAACHAAAAKSYRKTVHGEAAVHGSTRAASCADCHGAHDILPGIDSGSKVGKPNLASTCGRCHGAEAAQYRQSVHGRAVDAGVKEAPTCTDCHGEHNLKSPSSAESSVSSGTIARTCSSCHASERLIGKFNLPAGQVKTFRASYHGLAAKDGHGLHVANCASCHGWHDILPSSDPASRVNPAHVAETCGKCHAGAALRVGAGKIHQALSGAGEGSRAAGLLRSFYLLMIPLAIGGMLFHNLADLLAKALTGDRTPLRAEEDPLLTVWERVQHAALVVSFCVLAVSGFALKLQGDWPGEGFRREAHRAAALVFVLLSVAHGAYLAFSAEGRRRLAALLPARRDLRDPVDVLRFNLRLSKERPSLPRFSYIEKAEYWALAWGSGVMVATGAVFVFSRWSLKLLPLWVIESSRVVHFMEALLACLAILVWHGYWVVFDPEVYPMNWAWLTGRAQWGREDESGD